MARPLLLVIALMLISLCTAGLGVANPSPVQPKFNIADSEDLTVRLLHSKIHEPEIYARAISVLESQRTMPGCHRTAMSNLMDSCQSLERGRDVEIDLAEVREIFATRLAMCELSGAQATPPTECVPFVQSLNGCRKRSLMKYFGGGDRGPGNSQICFPEVNQSQLRSCVKALNGRPQLWTSYSNNLQNVLTVCHASRNAVEIGKIELEGASLRCLRKQAFDDNRLTHLQKRFSLFTDPVPTQPTISPKQLQTPSARRMTLFRQ
jgi:hypothetical protein